MAPLPSRRILTNQLPDARQPMVAKCRLHAPLCTSWAKKRTTKHLGVRAHPSHSAQHCVCQPDMPVFEPPPCSQQPRQGLQKNKAANTITGASRQQTILRLVSLPRDTCMNARQCRACKTRWGAPMPPRTRPHPSPPQSPTGGAAGSPLCNPRHQPQSPAGGSHASLTCCWC